ncbi:hypothetical protein H310_12759 [Aphanomyces invadans]|uniref:Mannosyltransferase n=1 Tax=Aphanomyces invadans TaxID=157072 RepID=A0A024TG59_9STRA|nr:hypothetical protein H310_12759 [Aphanomyces invadans]ETV93150.1 hypothetical protein H310_12759 [Aphanomyces invadans]|eukprot:XP_008878172.1 hypothetical protein H310_12759 [Aphanomyces invadans]
MTSSMRSRNATKNAPTASTVKDTQQDEKIHGVDDDEKRLWSPNFHSAFSLLAVVRVLSALVNIISDCDEVFNYWEPLHHLMHGFGLQTWEYSPAYALRSYLYLLAHAIPAKLGAVLVFGNTKLGFFFGLRVALAFISAASEALFYRGIVHAFGPVVGRYTLALLAFNSGLFLASTAFLPSSFVMYLLMLFSYAWMVSDKSFSVNALVAGVTAVLCGWPYVGVMCVPFFFDSIVRFGVVRPIRFGLVVVSLVLAAELAVNYFYYRKLVLPALNIVVYNVVSSGSELYGIEPWHYYAQNLVLNSNIAAVLALVSVPLTVGMVAMGRHRAQTMRQALFLSPLWIWLGIMIVQAHKEERFLFPVYPLVCAAAAFSLKAIHAVVTAVLPRRLGSVVVAIALILYTTLSVMRVASVSTQYGAPIRLYQHMATEVLPSAEPTVPNAHVIVCVGKEWHRFPSHFFFPDHVRLHFIRSGFRGQLPGFFNTTHNVPPNMNDQNVDEPSRYVPLSTCDFVVDRTVPPASAHPDEPGFDLHADWIELHAEPYLLAEASHRLFRAFYVPFYTPSHVKFTSYAVYGRKTK